MDTEIRVSTESRPWRRKFSHRSSRDSNPQPFNHESSTLTAELSPPPVSLLCEHLHVQDSLAETGKEAVLEEPTDLDLPLGMPPSFSDHNFQFYRRCIQVFVMQIKALTWLGLNAF